MQGLSDHVLKETGVRCSPASFSLQLAQEIYCLNGTRAIDNQPERYKMNESTHQQRKLGARRINTNHL